MNERNLIQKAFVKQVLQEEGRELRDNQSKAIAKLLNFHSNRLYDDRRTKVNSDGQLDGQLTMTIPAYGRVLDIKPQYRNRPESKYERWRKRRRAKAFPIYNRFVFGHYYTIAYRLMYGLTEEVAANIKKQFETEANG